MFQQFTDTILRLRFDTGRRHHVYKKLAAMHRHGVSFDNAVKAMAARDDDAVVRTVLAKWADTLALGIGVPAALAPWVPVRDIAILTAGEDCLHRALTAVIEFDRGEEMIGKGVMNGAVPGGSAQFRWVQRLGH